MPGDILSTIDRDPLFGFTEEECLAFLKESLLGSVINAYIFGSFGTPKFNKFSDIDLLIVCETERPFPERGLDFADLACAPGTYIEKFQQLCVNFINTAAPIGNFIHPCTPMLL